MSIKKLFNKFARLKKSKHVEESSYPKPPQVLNYISSDVPISQESLDELVSYSKNGVIIRAYMGRGMPWFTEMTTEDLEKLANPEYRKALIEEQEELGFITTDGGMFFKRKHY